MELSTQLISCIVCGDRFPKPSRSRSRVCSDACRSQRERDMRATADAERERHRSCVACGESLDSHSARGRCTLCYRAYRRENAAAYRCRVDGCNMLRVSDGLCSTHNNRRRAGLPLTLVEVACPCCEKTFQPTRDYMVFCSRQCMARVSQRRRVGIVDRPLIRSCWWCDAPFSSADFRRTNCAGVCTRIAKSLWSVQDKYGITRDVYKHMWREQGGKCACCGKPETSDRLNRLAVDHDHACCSGDTSCGACVRGLLCSLCNNMLGCARDSAIHLLAGAAYLDRTRQASLVVAV